MLLWRCLYVSGDCDAAATERKCWIIYEYVFTLRLISHAPLYSPLYLYTHFHTRTAAAAEFRGGGGGELGRNFLQRRHVGHFQQQK